MNRREILEAIGNTLVQKRKSLVAEIGDPTEKLGGVRGGGDVFHATTINEVVSCLELQGNLIRNIDDAIARIRDGTYGICERCAQNIPLARLHANPIATHCRDCQSAIETRSVNGDNRVQRFSREHWEKIKAEEPEDIDVQEAELE